MSLDSRLVPESPEYNFNFCRLLGQDIVFLKRFQNARRQWNFGAGTNRKVFQCLPLSTRKWVAFRTRHRQHGEPLPWRQLKMMCPFLRTFALESPTMSRK